MPPCSIRSITGVLEQWIGDSCYPRRHSHDRRSDALRPGVEVTLSGLVLPVGGIKEKMLAARRLGIRRVIIPKQNEKDLRDLPGDARNDMEFILAEHVHEVLRAAIPGLSEQNLMRVAA
jgi:hypothetical protein